MFWINATIDVLLVIYVFVCALMGLVIMMQRSKQEGLGAAFGGGFTESVWGAQTSQVLVKTTVVLAALFFILSISLARLYSYRASLSEKPSALQQELLKPVAAPVTNASATVYLPGAPTNSASQPVVPTATPMTPAPVVPASTATNVATPAAPAQPAAK